MTNVEKIITTAVFLYWTWRWSSFIYTTYSLSGTMTPSSASIKIKCIVMFCLMIASMLIHMLPMKDSPRLSLVHTIVSIPSQIHTIIFLHRFVAPTLDSFRFTVFVHVMSMLSIMETVYLLYVDWDRLE